MRDLSRREFLSGLAATAFAGGIFAKWGLAEGAAVPRMGVCDWSMGMGFDPGSLATAKAIGLDGVEISAGTPVDTLEISDAGLREKYKAAMAETGVTVCSMAMGFLNNAPLATDPRGPSWLEQSIDAGSDLGAKVLLMAFFGNGDLRKGRKLKEEEMKSAAARIRAAAPRAKDKGVILAVENTLSGRDNLTLLDMIGDDSVKVYYDIGNSTFNGFDVPAEIRELGDRICQIHFKAGKDFLGQGEVDVPAAVKAIQDIKYSGWIVLETSCPTKDTVADFRTNLEYTKGVFAGTQGGTA